LTAEEERILAELSQAIIKGQPDEALRKTEESLAAGIDPFQTILTMQSAMRTVGRYYEQKRYFLTEMYMGAQAIQAASEVLRPHLQARAQKAAGRIVLGTVRNDIHDVGKNLVRIVLEANGFEVHDLGVNVPSQAFIDKAREVDADIIGMSSLMTISMPEMERTIQALGGAGLLGEILTMVGGAPLSKAFATRIGGDAYAKDAAEAVQVAQALVRRRRGQAA
jgi:methanogenic corrinoid protein MtbC1